MYILSKHAAERKRNRKIPLSQIKQTILKPDVIIRSYRGRLLHRKQFGSRILEVVTRKEKQTLIIVTLYYQEAYEN